MYERANSDVVFIGALPTPLHGTRKDVTYGGDIDNQIFATHKVCLTSNATYATPKYILPGLKIHLFLPNVDWILFCFQNYDPTTPTKRLHLHLIIGKGTVLIG